MQLTDENIERFREAYRKGYGEELPVEEARVWAVRLMRLYSLLLTPTPRETAERLAKSRERATLETLPDPAPVEGRQPPSPSP